MLLFVALALAAPRHELIQVDRDGKEPLRTMVRWSPDAEGADEKRPVIVWSHGLFGSHESYEPLVRAWVEAGYVVVQPTHDDSLLGLTRKQIKAKMASPPLEIWRERPKDVARVLDALPGLDASVPDAPPLDLDHIGMGGHSFGAYTAMLVAGAADPRVHLQDPRPEAFVWLSPTGIGGKGPGDGKFIEGDMDPVERPVFFLTGSNDEANVRQQPPGWRLTSWRALDAPATLWFVDEGHHNMGGISGRVLPKAGPADPALVGWVSEATTSFWDVHLRGLPPGPWLEPTAAKAASNGRVRVEDKPAPETPPSTEEAEAAPEETDAAPEETETAPEETEAAP